MSMFLIDNVKMIFNKDSNDYIYALHCPYSAMQQRPSLHFASFLGHLLLRFRFTKVRSCSLSFVIDVHCSKLFSAEMMDNSVITFSCAHTFISCRQFKFSSPVQTSEELVIQIEMGHFSRSSRVFLSSRRTFLNSKTILDSLL